jgi:hypothetical protein
MFSIEVSDQNTALSLDIPPYTSIWMVPTYAQGVFSPFVTKTKSTSAGRESPFRCSTKTQSQEHPTGQKTHLRTSILSFFLSDRHGKWKTRMVALPSTAPRPRKKRRHTVMLRECNTLVLLLSDGRTRIISMLSAAQEPLILTSKNPPRLHTSRVHHGYQHLT